MKFRNLFVVLVAIMATASCKSQYEILLNAVGEAAQAAEREQQTITDRLDADRQRLAAQQAKLQIFTVQLAETEGTLAALEGEESETAKRTEDLTERMTRLRTGCAAMEAERTTALGHVEDLRQLQQLLIGDRGGVFIAGNTGHVQSLFFHCTHLLLFFGFHVIIAHQVEKSVGKEVA